MNSGLQGKLEMVGTSFEKIILKFGTFSVDVPPSILLHKNKNVNRSV